MTPLHWALVALLVAVAIVAFLVLRGERRRRRRDVFADVDGFVSWGRAYSHWEEGQELKESVKKSMLFWGGALAGITSAAVTHQLDVLKTLRHCGQGLPDTIGGYFVGMVMGSWAQGQRFGVTLLLNSTLQKKMDAWEKEVKQKGPKVAFLISFLLSMFAAGVGEFLSNPPVVVKNYQIANNCSIFDACAELYEMGGIPRFFNGVAMGVLRKSLANAIVLQSIGAVKHLCKAAFPSYLGDSDPTRKAALGFVAGSLTGAFAEVLTNHPDQVKTMTQAGVPFLEALAKATRNPFRGALWAGIRKGLIRGINWGCLELFMSLFEAVYRRHRRMKAAEDAVMGGRVSDWTREITPC